MVNFNYQAGDSTFYHFYQHAMFGLAHDIPRFGNDKNWVETLGDIGLWTIENFPGKVWELMNEPRWITLALTQIALVANSLLFYRAETLFYAKAALSQLPLPTRETVKFAAYLTIVAHIVSAAFRAYGRFRNDELMNDWYTNAPSPYMLPHAGAGHAVPVAVADDEKGVEV